MFMEQKRDQKPHIKDVRIKVWEETKGISGRLARPPKCEKHILRPDQALPQRYKDTEIRVKKEDTIMAARQLQQEGFRPMVLNLADDCFAGGCVDIGASAQEESLFRRTNYCMSLHNDPTRERLYPIAANEAIYSPDVTVFRASEEAEYKFLARPFKLDFIACPGLKYPQLEFASGDGRDSGHLSEADRRILENKPAQRSEEWYAARHQRLTASDAATALGLNPYETKDQLILKKCGYGPKFMGNEATRHGQKWETFASDLFCERHGFKAYDAGLLLHPTIPFLGGSPDGLLSTEDGSRCALLEIKCPLRREIKDEVPSYYYPQIQLCLEICDVDSCWFVQFKPESLIDDEVFSCIEVPRDREWFAKALPQFDAFWKEVLHCREHGVAEVLARIESRKRPRVPRAATLRVAVLDDEPAAKPEPEACMITVHPRQRTAAAREQAEEPCMIVVPPKKRIAGTLEQPREPCMIVVHPRKPTVETSEQCMIVPRPGKQAPEPVVREQGAVHDCCPPQEASTGALQDCCQGAGVVHDCRSPQEIDCRGFIALLRSLRQALKVSDHVRGESKVEEREDANYKQDRETDVYVRNNLLHEWSRQGGPELSLVLLNCQLLCEYVQELPYERLQHACLPIA
ncbi:hypothetical protein KFL_007120150 [Klebsormidium nitens]|uniref:YqaJ viral recombinase domain-containing protein n=1 Tax=Klebsormidium nitens TaxID=105231 RepID=A0A1Y1IPA6_KLENI|nr:hypothetical protein KFL_007120150 [Klebsormidium nitens]|eukprot:GAQ91011.1 hypothetical protein KFL_007120150 [Klebsormidium nitens]